MMQGVFLTVAVELLYCTRLKVKRRVIRTPVSFHLVSSQGNWILCEARASSPSAR